MKTGKPVWDTKLIDSEKLTVGFTGAPLVVKDKVIIGAQGGEWPCRGPIFGVDAKTGQKKWEFFTVGGTDGRQGDLGQRLLADRRRRRLDARRLRPRDQHRLVGHGKSGAAVRLVRCRLEDERARARATNLYTTSVIALDPDTGKLKFYHQELPHDAWDFDCAVGEFVMIERDGKKFIVHPNKGGFIFVYDRNAKVQNVWRIVKNINFVKDIDPKTGELIGRRDLSPARQAPPLCPAIAGGVSWNAGSYNPKTGLCYKIGRNGAWTSRW